jgi:hypothetical protein
VGFRISAWCDEFSRISAVDVVSTVATATASTTITTPSVTPTVNGDLCWTGAVDENAQGGSPTPASPFTLTTGTNNTVYPVVTAYYVQPTAGAITLQWSNFGAAAITAAAMVCFKATVSNHSPPMMN